MPLYNVIAAHAICWFCQVCLVVERFTIHCGKTQIVCAACLWGAYWGIDNLLWACTCSQGLIEYCAMEPSTTCSIRLSLIIFHFSYSFVSDEFYREEKYDITSPWQHYIWMTTKPMTTVTEGEWQKSNKFLLTKQQICTCITLFCIFLCLCCTLAT